MTIEETLSQPETRRMFLHQLLPRTVKGTAVVYGAGKVISQALSNKIDGLFSPNEAEAQTLQEDQNTPQEKTSNPYKKPTHYESVLDKALAEYQAAKGEPYRYDSKISAFLESIRQAHKLDDIDFSHARRYFLEDIDSKLSNEIFTINQVQSGDIGTADYVFQTLADDAGMVYTLLATPGTILKIEYVSEHEQRINFNSNGQRPFKETLTLNGIVFIVPGMKLFKEYLNEISMVDSARTGTEASITDVLKQRFNHSEWADLVAKRIELLYQSY